MNQQTYNRGSGYIVKPADQEPPECPPEDVYTLTFMGIKEIGLGRPFKEGDEPRVQFTLEFKIDAPDASSPQAEWHHFDLIGWYAPILHYNPDMPGYSGQRYTEPNMYKLARALNGGTPLALDVARDPVSGKESFAPYDAEALVETLIGNKFRSVIGPAPSGWPRLKGDPMPIPQPGSGRRRSASAPVTEGTATAPEPALVDAAGDASDPFAEEDV